MVKEDFRDYHEAEGVSAFVAQRVRSVTVRATVIRSQHRAVKNSVRTSLTRWDEDFRPNPAADEGDYRAVNLAIDYDTRPSHRSPATAQWWRLAFETAGGDLGGDFDFSRLLLDVRNFLRTSPGQQLSWRLVYGTKLSGTPPLQKRFGIGGVGTLRGQSFKRFNGEDVLLGDVEYRFDFSNHSFAMVFLDTGATADVGESLDKKQFALDGGVGIGLQSERAALYLARDVRDASADIRVNFRLASTF
jgi:outer membrane protein insertion porin family